MDYYQSWRLHVTFSRTVWDIENAFVHFRSEMTHFAAGRMLHNQLFKWSIPTPIQITTQPYINFIPRLAVFSPGYSLFLTTSFVCLNPLLLVSRNPWCPQFILRMGTPEQSGLLQAEIWSPFDLHKLSVQRITSHGHENMHFNELWSY